MYFSTFYSTAVVGRILARKMSQFYVIIARKNICSRILGVSAPVCYAYVDRQYKRHYLRCPKRITGQAKVKQTSGPQTVKTHSKSFFAFYTCFRTSISQIQFRILYAVHFRTFAFSHFAFYTILNFPSPGTENSEHNSLFSVLHGRKIAFSDLHFRP